VDDFNPYAAPKAAVSANALASESEEGRGVWRDGNTLVMAKVARLLTRCVKCNAPATYLLKRSFSWHNQALYLMILFPGLIFYVIVALIVRKTAKIDIPLCEAHRARRSKDILIAWIVSLSGIALCFAPAFNENLVILVLVGIVMLLSGLIYGSLRSQVVTPQKIDKTHAWLNKVGPSYLATLPPLPTYDDDDDEKPKGKLLYDVEL
jgi:hypothetical protein